MVMEYRSVEGGTCCAERIKNAEAISDVFYDSDNGPLPLLSTKTMVESRQRGGWCNVHGTLWGV
jgi:hypothetical protein